jgi:NAD(P)-dependent dehydrogenase (short-subunit alcohol dehydrogenase family)
MDLELRGKRAVVTHGDALRRFVSDAAGELGGIDVATAAVFLASPRASFVSGANRIVDGARSVRVQF